MNNYRNNFLIHTNFLTLTTVGLFHFCKKVFILMNIYIYVYIYIYIYIYIYTDANYANAVRVYKDFRNKTFWRISWIIYSKRYIKKKKTLFLADVFENLRNMCLEIYELDPAKFLLALGLELQVASKRSKSNWIF